MRRTPPTEKCWAWPLEAAMRMESVAEASPTNARLSPSCGGWKDGQVGVGGCGWVGVGASLKWAG